MNRIDRLTAILIQLQTKRVVKAEEIADRFEISLRTVYRDVKALMEAGVPVGSEAGKGYFIVDGYHLPPVMFTRDEASAMMMAGKLVEKMTDKSIRTEFESALLKIRSVLHNAEKDHLESLQSHIEVWRHPATQGEFPDHFLADIQKSVVEKEVLRMEYFSNKEAVTQRDIEPIGLCYYGSSWHLIAWCRLRNGYRDFRADRIKTLISTGDKFDARNLVSLQEYLSTILDSNREMERISILFDKQSVRFIGNTKFTYGFISEEKTGELVRMTFLTCYVEGICRWLLMFGKSAVIEYPERLKDRMTVLIEELNEHYKIFSEV